MNLVFSELMLLWLHAIVFNYANWPIHFPELSPMPLACVMLPPAGCSLCFLCGHLCTCCFPDQQVVDKGELDSPSCASVNNNAPAMASAGVLPLSRAVQEENQQAQMQPPSRESGGQRGQSLALLSTSSQ